MSTISYAIVMKALKNLLRAQKISYADLANRIDVPEDTLKKWFTSTDGAYSRISLICQAAGVSFSELLKDLERQNVVTYEMGGEQQAYFSKDYHAFKVYWLLVYERLSVESIQKLLQLNLGELKKILLKLDRFKLIELGPYDKVVTPEVVPIRWSPKGVFMRKIFTDWSHGVIEKSTSSEKSGDIILQYFQISSESEVELREDLIKLEEKYARRTSREMGMKEIEIKKMRFLCALAEGGYV